MNNYRDQLGCAAMYQHLGLAPDCCLSCHEEYDQLGKELCYISMHGMEVQVCCRAKGIYEEKSNVDACLHCLKKASYMVTGADRETGIPRSLRTCLGCLGRYKINERSGPFGWVSSIRQLVRPYAC